MENDVNMLRTCRPVPNRTAWSNLVSVTMCCSLGCRNFLEITVLQDAFIIQMFCPPEGLAILRLAYCWTHRTCAGRLLRRRVVLMACVRSGRTCVGVDKEPDEMMAERALERAQHYFQYCLRREHVLVTKKLEVVFCQCTTVSAGGRA